MYDLKKQNFHIYSLILLFVSLVSQPAQAGSHGAQPASVMEKEYALTYSQAAIGNKVGDYGFQDQDGRPVNLSDYLGKPLVVSLIYTSCHHTCPIITKHLDKVVAIARDALGSASFAVVTIGFDTAVDTPARMRLYARQRGIEFKRWDFLSGDAAAVEGMSRDLGFIFTASAKGFDHLAQTTVLDAGGRVYRQVYGETFDTPMLVEPLKELVFGRQTAGSRIGDWVNGIRLFCTIYDPASGRYQFDYSIFVTIFIGLLCLGSVAVFIIRAWRQ